MAKVIGKDLERLGQRAGLFGAILGDELVLDGVVGRAVGLVIEEKEDAIGRDGDFVAESVDVGVGVGLAECLKT